MCRRRVPRVLTVEYWLLCLILLLLYIVYCAGTALLGVIVVNGRLLRNAFAAAPQWHIYIYNFIFFIPFPPTPRRRCCITFFRAVFTVYIILYVCGMWWVARINITRYIAREMNIALKRQHPRASVCACVRACVCVCCICSIIIVYVIVAIIIIFRRLLLSSTSVCESARCRRCANDVHRVDRDGTAYGGAGELYVSAVYRLTSRISPSPPKIRRHPARDLSSVGTRRRPQSPSFFPASHYVFTMII